MGDTAAGFDHVQWAAEAVDAIADIYGRHKGERAVHAKGRLCAATFTATPAAGRLSRAGHLQGDPVSARVRFSNGGGDPAAPDGAVDGRGLAVTFDLSDGTATDIVAITLPVFFVRTPEDFLAFTRARKPDPETGQPDFAKVGAFLEAHPEAVPAIQAALAARAPASYLECSFNGLHAFRLVNVAGDGTWVRWTLEPDEPGTGLEPDDAGARDRDYLQTDLGDRLGASPAGFTLVAVIGQQDDPLDDPTVAWPQERERVAIGRLQLTGLASDREQDGDVLVFDPTRVVDGIECSDDPILHARSWAYSESVLRRTGVPRGF
jgi:catalase